ncbi:MAG TPA: hypothetical protein VNO21_21705 [Polyangiaceae bacterium]|nr:hypothetical protein [Polyangiaceae bacterium]
MDKVTILYSDVEDPLALAIPSDTRVHKIHVDELASFFRKDERWAVPTFSAPDRIRSRFHGRVVLNRIFNLQSTKLGALLQSWGFHELWVHFLLSELLAESARLVHDTGPRGVSRTLLPLNSQWLMVNDLEYAISTPAYVYNFGGELVELDAIDNPIQKSVWSLFDWRQERHLPAGEAAWHRFFVQKPTGSPVLCYFFDIDRLGEDGLAVVPLRDPVSIPMDKMLTLAKLLATKFASAIGEFLIYVGEDENIRFHAFSPYLKTASSHGDFVPLFNRWLESHQSVTRFGHE